MKKVFFLLAVIAYATTSCEFIEGERVTGNGNWKSDERQVSGFKDIDVSGAIDVHVTQGEAKPVRVEVDENLQQYVETYVEGGTLVIKTRNGYNIDPSREMNVYVTAPSFSSIQVSGACDIISENKINNPEPIDVQVTGAGDVKMELNAPRVSVDISGAGNAIMVGETRDFDLGISGAGKAKCFDLRAENVTIDISGAGSAEVFASVKLNASTSGAGSVRYKGNPGSVSESKSGAGSISKAE